MLAQSRKLTEEYRCINYTAHHEIISISVCSNDERFDKAHTFVLENSQHELIKRFVNYIADIADCAYEELLIAYSDVFEEIT